MTIKILYDNKTIGEQYKYGWGFSCLIDNKLLFDTGEEYAPIAENAKEMNIDLSKIKTIVISHDHWDHTGGLWDFLERNKGMSVHGCHKFSNEFKQKVAEKNGILIENYKSSVIFENIYTSGEIQGKHKGKSIVEQFLIVKRDTGIVIITGCAHPGIVNIIHKAKEFFPSQNILMAIGGFHLKDDNEEKIKEITEEFRSLGVQKIGATHCSGTLAEQIIEDVYKENYIQLGSGTALEI